MSIERRVIADYYVVDEPFTDESDTERYLGGNIVIAPESARGERKLKILWASFSQIHTELVDFSRITNSSEYQGRISAIIHVPNDAKLGDYTLENPTFKSLLDVAYSIIGRVIADDKKSL